ncbi:MAG: NHL repeat-containing protein [Nitrospiraceae bacterium]|nr:MAG: NHL repeat-containing protein [Nitrospiraceae bacterium]
MISRYKFDYYHSELRIIYRQLIILFVLLGIPLSVSALECINSEFLFDIKGKINQPSDIAVAADGNIYFVDGVNNRIIVVGRDGRFKFSFGQEGSGKGDFIRPLGIDITDSGTVFIADTGNHRIQVFDLKGEFKYMFTVKSGPGERPSDPVDVQASSIQNYLYISDNDNHKIKVYDQNGTYAFEWGAFGEEYGSFRYPGMMSINEYHEIFIVDVLNTRVQKFDPFGKYITDIGSWGVLQGELFRPKGVAVDNQNRVYISDSYMGVVQVFTDLGRYLGVICEDNSLKKFEAPVGLAVSDKKLFIVEMRGNKLTVLKLSI